MGKGFGDTMKGKRTIGDKFFTLTNTAVLLIVLFVTLYPFWYVVVGSVSSIAHVMRNSFLVWPDGFNLDGFMQVFRNDLVPTAYRNTIFVVLVGTVLSMVLTIMGAFVLSLRKLPGHTFLTLFVVLTMLFSGGLVPFYLAVLNVGLINSIWALILPGCISAYNMILLRNFFQNVPESLYESASIDGVRLTGYLVRILLPLSTSALATIALFYAVGYWNAYFHSLIFIRDRSLWPMQTVLREILMTDQFNTMMYDDAKQTLAPETIKNAMIVITVLPIVCVYPFVQRFFVKGILVGALKG